MAFLDNDDDVWGDEPTTEIVEEVEQVQEPEVTPEPVEAEQPETPEPEQAVEEKFNPTLYREMKEERAKRQAAERELNELRAKVPAPKPQEPAQIPDAYEDPAGFNQYVQGQIEQARWESKAEMSGFMAEQKFGKPLVEEALKWAQAHPDPTLGLKVKQAASPVEFVVSEYQQSRTLERLGGKSFEDAAQEYAKSQGWIVSPETPVSPSLEPSRPRAPRGLSNAPGSGGVKQVQNADWGEVKFALDR